MRTLNQERLNTMAEFINTYQKENGRSPSYRNIMHAMGMSSLKLDTGEMAIAPLVGQIACGEPCFEVENIEESFALPRSVFGNGDLFMLRAFGDSMIDAGINKGDLLVIRKQQDANDGDIVVALTSGNNTLKRLYHRNGKIVLHPENKTMTDIIVSNCEIQGVLVGCIKTY